MPLPSAACLLESHIKTKVLSRVPGMIITWLPMSFRPFIQVRGKRFRKFLWLGQCWISQDSFTSTPMGYLTTITSRNYLLIWFLNPFLRLYIYLNFMLLDWVQSSHQLISFWIFAIVQCISVSSFPTWHHLQIYWACRLKDAEFDFPGCQIQFQEWS